jgi:hypothetical protein
MFAERLICSWIGAFGLVAGAFCQTYVQILVDGSIDAQCGTGCVTNAFSINNAGTVAGTYFTIGGREHGFVRAPDGTITTFDAPESAGGTVVTSINDKGAITGVGFPGPIGFATGYIRDPEGNFTRFNAPGSTSMAPQSINAGGAVTGWYFDGSGVQHGFIREDNGTITSFDPPAAPEPQL